MWHNKPTNPTAEVDWLIVPRIYETWRWTQSSPGSDADPVDVGITWGSGEDDCLEKQMGSPRWEDSMLEPSTHLQSMSTSPYDITGPLSLWTPGLLCSALKEPVACGLSQHPLAGNSQLPVGTQLVLNISEAFCDGWVRYQSMAVQPPFLGTGLHAAARMAPLSSNLGFPF